jgi:aminoglycoside phosphotransferase (APT) family kinase protein
MKDLTISAIAQLIRKDYQSKGKPVHPHAKPYVDAMACMHSIDDNFGLDDGRGIVAYALGNLTTWKGQTAREVKSELNRRLKG